MSADEEAGGLDLFQAAALNELGDDALAAVIAALPRGRHSLARLLGDPSLARGVALLVQPEGSRSWTLRYPHPATGERVTVGLGGWPKVSPTEALAAAELERRRAVVDHDPVLSAAKEAVRAAGRDPSAGMTFEEASHGASAIAAKRSKHPERMRAKWAADVERHCQDLLHRPVRHIARAEVIAAVNEIADHAPTMAKRVRGLIRRSIDFARAQDETIGANPADSGIDAALDFNGHRTAHHKALPAAEIPAALAAVEAQRDRWATVAVSLRFLVLTAARTSEVRFADWAEIDFETATWSVPAERMKMGRPHRVPLSAQALGVLEEARALGGERLIFPSPVKTGRPLTHKCLRQALRVCEIDGTVHGMRSSFADWAVEAGWAEELVSKALAHATGSQSDRAYLRSDRLEQRRPLMQDWADFLDTTV